MTQHLTQPRDASELDGGTSDRGSSAKATNPTANAGRHRAGWEAVWLVALLVISWALPYATERLGVNWLLPPLILLVTASLLRSGKTLLDRLMFTFGLLLGWLCAIGLVFTIWPDSMSPLLASGGALTILSAFHVLTGRRPSLPALRMSDVISIAAAAAIAGLMAFRWIIAGPAQRIAMLDVGEDGARHLTAFHGILRSGGYLLWQPTDASPITALAMLRYPQGWHLTAALFDQYFFAPAEGLTLLNHYMTWVFLGFGLFVLAVVWATQWIAGQGLKLWQRLTLMAFVTGFILVSDFSGLMTFGAPSEVHGLTMLALLVATLVRPTRRYKEQLVLIGGLVIGIGFTYYLLLPCAALASLIWLIRNRRALVQQKVLLLMSAVAIAIVALAPIALVMGMIRETQAISAVLTSVGVVLPVNRIALYALGGLAVVGAAAFAKRGSPIWIAYLWTLPAILAESAAIQLVQQMRPGEGEYYYDKTLHAVGVTVLIGLGGALFLFTAQLRRVWVDRRALGRRHGIALLVIVVTVLGLVEPIGEITGDSPARKWVTGYSMRQNEVAGRAVAAALSQVPAKPGTLTVVLSDDWISTHYLTLYLSSIQGTSNVADPVLNHANREAFDLLDFTAAETEFVLLNGPIRLVSTTPTSDTFVPWLIARHPGLAIEHVKLDGSPYCILTPANKAAIEDRRRPPCR